MRARFSIVLFDLDNTLVDRDAAARELWRRELPAPRAARAIELDAPGRGRAELLRYLGWDARRLSFAVAELIRPDPTVARMVARVGSCFAIAVASNGGPAQRRKLLRARLDTLFSHVFVSSELEVDKPATAFFERVTHAMGGAPESVLMVGDDPVNDICGARRAGLNTCWVSHGRAFPPHLPRPDFSIEHVAELETLLC